MGLQATPGPTQCTRSWDPWMWAFLFGGAIFLRLQWTGRGSWRLCWSPVHTSGHVTPAGLGLRIPGGDPAGGGRVFTGAGSAARSAKARRCVSVLDPPRLGVSRPSPLESKSCEPCGESPQASLPEALYRSCQAHRAGGKELREPRTLEGAHGSWAADRSRALGFAGVSPSPTTDFERQVSGTFWAW